MFSPTATKEWDLGGYLGCRGGMHSIMKEEKKEEVGEVDRK